MVSAPITTIQRVFMTLLLFDRGRDRIGTVPQKLRYPKPGDGLLIEISPWTSD
jgi:hypothetical protein